MIFVVFFLNLVVDREENSAHRVLRRSPSAPQVKMLFHYHINDVHHQISFEDDFWCFVFGWSMAKSSGLWQNPWILPLITSMGFAMVPWKSPLHGEIHIPWFLPWYMAFTICNGFSHRIPKSHLDERCIIHELTWLFTTSDKFRNKLFHYIVIQIFLCDAGRRSDDLKVRQSSCGKTRMS